MSWHGLWLLQVLEVTEQLLRQTDILSNFSHKQLPADSLTGAFLTNLASTLAQQPELGSVIKYAGSWCAQQAVHLQLSSTCACCSSCSSSWRTSKRAAEAG